MNALIVLLGPTAAGKTALGIALAQKMNGAVISADSRQVFAGLNIGTAKPKEAWQDASHDVLTADRVDGVDPVRAKPPKVAEAMPLAAAGRVSNVVDHYLLNIREPDEPYTLAQWQADAYQVIEHIQAHGKTPLLVGGTMLYLDSIIFNYNIPAVAPNPKLRQELAQKSTSELYQQLLTHDAAAADFIEPHHQQRIIRALEVIAATGKPFSASRQRSPARYRLKIMGLSPGWDALEKNIRTRAQHMMKDGLVEETRQLQRRYSPTLPLLKTMNYQQAMQVTSGELLEKKAIEAMVQANLRYAHRQMSWWKKNPSITWYATTAAAYHADVVTLSEEK